MYDTVEYEFFEKETDIESQVFFDEENETDLESQVFDDSDDNNSCDNFINYCNNYGKLYLTCITWISILLIMVMALGSEKRPSDQITSRQYCFCPRIDCVNDCLNSSIWDFV